HELPSFPTRRSSDLNKSQDSRRKRGRQPDRRKFLERNFRMFLQGARVDILFRDKKQHHMSALAQHFRDSKSRKKMPASSSTCDNGVHEMIDGRRSLVDGRRDALSGSAARIPESAICNSQFFISSASCALAW